MTLILNWITKVPARWRNLCSNKMFVHVNSVSWQEKMKITHNKMGRKKLSWPETDLFDNFACIYFIKRNEVRDK
jgi:hypothetical protein